MKIRENIFLLSGGIYGQLGNVVGIRHKDGLILVDDGNPNAVDTIRENLQYWRMTEKDVTHVFLTHGHDDHAGTSKFFQDAGAKIVVGKDDAYMLRQGNFGERSPFKNHTMPPCDPDVLIENDTHLSIGGVEIDAYVMPGHTNGTLVYEMTVDGESVLFTGDMFNCDGEKGDIATTWWPGDMDFNAQKLGESFARLWDMKLAPTIVIGGHGNPRIGKDAKDMIMIAYKYYLLNCRL